MLLVKRQNKGRFFIFVLHSWAPAGATLFLQLSSNWYATRYVFTVTAVTKRLFKTGSYHSSGCYSSPSHRGGPGSNPGRVICHLWWAEWHWSRFSPSTSVSPSNSHSVVCSTLIEHPVTDAAYGLEAKSVVKWHRKQKKFFLHAYECRTITN
jgi:hypothetical protein